MNTFETMKHNIPEGATHYHNENDDYEFCWFKIVNGEWFAYCPKEAVEGWTKCIVEHERDGFEAIPTETPEEKEALDAIEQVGWKNGDTAYVENCIHDEIKFVGLAGNTAVAVCECITSDRRVILDKFWLSDLLKEKPETPEEKKEREELEAAYDLYCFAKKESIYTCVIAGFNEFVSDFPASEREWYLAIVRKTGYRKSLNDVNGKG